VALTTFLLQKCYDADAFVSLLVEGKNKISRNKFYLSSFANSRREEFYVGICMLDLYRCQKDMRILLDEMHSFFMLSSTHPPFPILPTCHTSQSSPPTNYPPGIATFQALKEVKMIKEMNQDGCLDADLEESMKNLHELQAQQRSLNGGLVDLQNQLGAESIM
jgi:hypothetical protein